MSYDNQSQTDEHYAEHDEGFDTPGVVDVNKVDFVDADGNVDFDKLQSVWQTNQPAMQNGLQQVQIFHKNGEPMYFKARMSVVVDLMKQWYDVRQAMNEVNPHELPDDVEPVWFAITGAFCNTVDLRDVHGIQARPGGNYRSNDTRRRGPPPRRGYQGNSNRY